MDQKTQNYKDLVVWQKGISLAKAIYRLTTQFPAEEKFGLVSQMRRAALFSKRLAFIENQDAPGESGGDFCVGMRIAI